MTISEISGATGAKGAKGSKIATTTDIVHKLSCQLTAKYIRAKPEIMFYFVTML